MIAGAAAQAIVDDIVARLGVNVNIMDEHGVITASSDRGRVGSLHEGALRVLDTGMPFSVTGEEARALNGTRAGVNLPLRLGDEVVGVVGVSGEPREVGEIARAISRMAELMALQQAFLGEAGWRHRVRQQIVQDLIAGRLTWESWRQRQQLAGCRVEPPYALFVLHDRPAGNGRDPHDLYRLLEADESAVLAAEDTEGAVWALAGGSAAVSLRHRLSTLCGSRRDSGYLDAGRAGDFTALLERAAQARFALRRRLRGEVHLSDLELPVLLARIEPETRAATAERILGPLSPELRNTLRAYFDHDRGITDAARALNVHRNTLTYRLGRVQDLTSRDPRAFQDAVVLQVALHLCELD
ncbi:sugar diacid recognition domain-containing protein [Streptomyces amakusaensis]|uniref:CdaR family transcriptional regulator n=1 Tax=Streptomyces amakusaensis TaxID=67271 RepID=A0ABW0AFU1_9ACTN